MNIMLAICSACSAVCVFTLMAESIEKKRRIHILFLELSTVALLFFDRLAYIYSGDTSRLGFVMVRLSNYIVFSFTLLVVIALNLYIDDILHTDGKLKKTPVRIVLVNVIGIVGVLLVTISQFTGLYYYFDDMNRYHRGPGFLICYILPMLGSLIQITILIQYRKRLSKRALISMVAFIVIPVFASVLQIFAYGLSLTNMSLATIAVFVYVMTLRDYNEVLKKAERTELDYWKDEQKSMQRLFEQTVSAFVTAIDSKDPYTEGHSVRVATTARRIAEIVGKSEKECDEVYYAGLLHDVGKIGISDQILQHDGHLTPEQYETWKHKSDIGYELLTQISEYPYLRDAAHYVHERYNGSGYPEGLKGEEIPEIARIIAVADYYDAVSSPKRYRSAYPKTVIREEYIKGAGTLFDPRFAAVMVEIMDKEETTEESGRVATHTLDASMSCDAYRSEISRGILVDHTVTEVTFKCTAKTNSETGFSMPSLIVFDSYDGMVLTDEKTIDAFHYLEYCELWFDGHVVSTRARSMKVDTKEIEEAKKSDSYRYKVTMGRFEDHLRIRMEGQKHVTEVIIAVPTLSNFAYVGLTGEYCNLSGIEVNRTDREVKEEEIERIAPKPVYTNRMESDLPNIQIERFRSKSTEGVELMKDLHMIFHSMSLPSASLVWNCPQVVIYTSADGKIEGPDYIEYAFLKLNGENEGKYDHSKNSIDVSMGEAFTNWEDWKQENKKGVECDVRIRRKGNTIVTETEDAGVFMKNTTVIQGEADTVYVALTGDQCVLTDIRVKNS